MILKHAALVEPNEETLKIEDIPAKCGQNMYHQCF